MYRSGLARTSEIATFEASDNGFNSVTHLVNHVQVRNGAPGHSPYYTTTEYTRLTFGFVVAILPHIMETVSNNSCDVGFFPPPQRTRKLDQHLLFSSSPIY